MSVSIVEVTNNKLLGKFIDFPYSLYKNHPYYCPQIRMGEFELLDKKKNPAFEYCEARYWLAYQNDKIVGRIASILNHKSNEKWNEKHLRFGWIDFIDDLEVSKALINTVENWAKEKGLSAIHGPLGFTDMDCEGMLIKGFDELSTIATIYNYPYYPQHLEKHGYLKDVDWVQNEFDVPAQLPEKFEQMANLVKQKYNLHTLEAKKAKDLLPYAKEIFHSMNKSFDKLYGYVALTDKQIDLLVKQYFSFIRPEFVCIVLDANDKVAGFGISLPSLTKAMQKTKNGKLYPFGFIHMLKAMKKNELIDMYVNGVLPEYQGKGVHVIYYAQMCKAYIKYGVKKAVTNPQLEENASALNVWKHFNGRQHISRRCYIKHLSNH